MSMAMLEVRWLSQKRAREAQERGSGASWLVHGLLSQKDVARFVRSPRPWR